MTRVAWDGVSEQSLAEALARANPHCVEAAIISCAAPRRTASRSLCLRLTTGAAYRLPIAKAFARTLQARLPLSEDLRERVHTALQEALINAMLHGNLGLASNPGCDLYVLANWHKLIEARLTDLDLALRPIAVDATWTKTSLSIAVRDSGRGFMRGKRPSSDDPAAVAPVPCGRGFAILDALCDQVALSRSGTAVAFRFRLP